MSLCRCCRNAGTEDPAYLIGRGKAEELVEQVAEYHAQVVIFDEDLSPAQTRNLENLMEVKIIDRSRLILDIFASRAKTREAQNTGRVGPTHLYVAPVDPSMGPIFRGRLAVLVALAGWVRAVRVKRSSRWIDGRPIAALTSSNKHLTAIARQRAIARKQRTDIFRAALVGYTNAGKSTLMRALSGANVLIEDRLFATLDSTTRRVSPGL